MDEEIDDPTEGTLLPDVPPEICGDCRDRRAPRDLLWRLRRLATFFPLYGRNVETILLLHRHRERLGLPAPKRRVNETFRDAVLEP